MKNKGFTLIELLAVILILGLIITLFATNFFTGAESTKKKLDELMQKELKDAAQIYAIDQNLKDCNNCLQSDLNTNCILANSNKEIEKSACKAHSISVTLGVLKTGNYFTDTAGHCMKFDNNKNKINDNEIIINIYRYESDYFVELNGITCRK